MRKSLLTVSGALLLSVVLSGCAVLGSAAFLGITGALNDSNVERCYDVEVKILKYAAKGTARYKRDMAREDCNT
jgi:hypothetical protein